MDIKRFCGNERLLGSERRWRRLARKVGFDGRVEVYGYGVKGRPGTEQRREMRGLQVGLTTFADFSTGLIRVWLPCSCAAAEYDKDERPGLPDPLTSFAHELGHFVIETRGKKYLPDIEEALAERYGRQLLRAVQ